MGYDSIPQGTITYISGDEIIWVSDYNGNKYAVDAMQPVEVTAHGDPEPKFIPVGDMVEKPIKKEPFRFKKGISKK
jgi:hypothetical protein